MRTQSATPIQRMDIKKLLAAAGYDRGTISRKYMRLGVSSSWIDRSVDAWLDSLSFPEAQASMRQLEKDAAHGARVGARA